MLNPIENVFSVYKSAVKRFLARQRPAILRVPEVMTITEHRSKFLELATDPLFAEILTLELCNRTCCHSLLHHQRALCFEDMQFANLLLLNPCFCRCDVDAGPGLSRQFWKRLKANVRADVILLRALLLCFTHHPPCVRRFLQQKLFHEEGGNCRMV
ncbi:hypothetical protein PR003_g8197 [Phytophthora rubi]|uniref:Uncharacterized protein n=1 Tax=Phytophthora rubi TaxID=129364 RepID=A0A6A4FJS1_9STRA|nr:hypothetical protein PR003_g8197 [Phytophthora rubi]